MDIPGYFISVPVNLGFPFFGMWVSSMYVHVLGASIAVSFVRSDHILEYRLFGVLSLQAWRYFQDYPNDRLDTKLLVRLLLARSPSARNILDTVPRSSHYGKFYTILIHK